MGNTWLTKIILLTRFTRLIYVTSTILITWLTYLAWQRTYTTDLHDLHDLDHMTHNVCDTGLTHLTWHMIYMTSCIHRNYLHNLCDTQFTRLMWLTYMAYKIDLRDMLLMGLIYVPYMTSMSHCMTMPFWLGGFHDLHLMRLIWLTWIINLTNPRGSCNQRDDLHNMWLIAYMYDLLTKPTLYDSHALHLMREMWHSLQVT